MHWTCVFDQRYEDEFYKARRRPGVVPGLAINRPGLFCESMGVDRLNPEADVVIHVLGKGLAWEPKTWVRISPPNCRESSWRRM